MVAQRTWARAARRLHAGQRALPADARFIHEPDLDGLALGGRRQAGGYKTGKPALKTACASGSLFGCCGRTDKRRNASLRSSLPTVRSCRLTPHSRSIRSCRSTQRQRTTPSCARSGPYSTHPATTASCSDDKRGFGPLRRGRSAKPASPSALKQCTQSRNVCRSMSGEPLGSTPQHLAASSRDCSSMTHAIASIRRAAFASRVRPASRRKSPTDTSRRVIATAMIAPESNHSEERTTNTVRTGSRPSQRSGRLV